MCLTRSELLFLFLALKRQWRLGGWINPFVEGRRTYHCPRIYFFISLISQHRDTKRDSEFDNIATGRLSHVDHSTSSQMTSFSRKLTFITGNAMRTITYLLPKVGNEWQNRSLRCPQLMLSKWVQRISGCARKLFALRSSLFVGKRFWQIFVDIHKSGHASRVLEVHGGLGNPGALTTEFYGPRSGASDRSYRNRDLTSPQ